MDDSLIDPNQLRERLRIRFEDTDVTVYQKLWIRRLRDTEFAKLGIDMPARNLGGLNWRKPQEEKPNSRADFTYLADSLQAVKLQISTVHSSALHAPLRPTFLAD